MATTGQPIIRGIQAVGGVQIKYVYNTSNGYLPIPKSFQVGEEVTYIDTSAGLDIAGFRLDGEFLRAAQQIASSVVIPILGGGGVALTNNNRTGTLNINATKVSTPDLSTEGAAPMLSSGGIGPKDGATVYDLVTIAQIQQGQEGGDSVGATISVGFDFCGKTTIIEFIGCTIASVDPIGLSGNDAANYNVAINYLDWTCYFDQNTVSVHDSAAVNTGSD